MTTRGQNLRSSVTGNLPPAGARLPGEIWVNFPDLQLGLIDAAKNPQKLVAVRFFSVTANYVAGDMAVQGGSIWIANGAITAGAFNSTQWTKVATGTDTSAFLPLAGGTMTGPLLLAADPSAALGAATKQYVDTKGAVFAQTTPPAGPPVNALWWNNTDGNLYIYYNDGSSAQWVAANSSVIPAVPSPKTYLSGLGLTWVTTGQQRIAPGECAAADGTLMVLPSAITKGLGANWAVGDGSGGLDAGVMTAATTYHVFLIMRTDTGVVDALYSTSPTSPALPTNYTKFRRILSLRTDGTNNIPKYSQNGDEVLWDVPSSDLSGGGVGTAATVGGALAPGGIKINLILSVTFSNTVAASRLLVSSLDVQDVAPSVTNANVTASTANVGYGGLINIRSQGSNLNTAQYRFRGDNATGNVWFGTVGYIDTRGRA